MEIFVERLNQTLKENKITRYKLAKILKCSKQTVCNWCDGTATPNIIYLKKIAIFLGVKTDYLLGLENYDGSRVSKNNTYNNYGTHEGPVNF